MQTMQHDEKMQVYKKGCIFCSKVLYLYCIEITKIKRKNNTKYVEKLHFVAYA